MNNRCTRPVLAALVMLVSSAGAQSQTKWDMPTGYPPSNFHTENIQQFAADVDKASGGKLKITVHTGGSLFKANEIKRAVQAGQAQIGEIIISGLRQRGPAVRARFDPLPGHQLPRGEEAVAGVEAGHRSQARQVGADGAVQRAVASAGHLQHQADRQRGRPEGREVARLQPGHQPHRAAGRRAAGDDPGRRADAGAGHRGGQRLHDLAQPPATTARSGSR